MKLKYIFLTIVFLLFIQGCMFDTDKKGVPNKPAYMNDIENRIEAIPDTHNITYYYYHGRTANQGSTIANYSIQNGLLISKNVLINNYWAGGYGENCKQSWFIGESNNCECNESINTWDNQSESIYNCSTLAVNFNSIEYSGFIKSRINTWKNITTDLTCYRVAKLNGIFDTECFSNDSYFFLHEPLENSSLKISCYVGDNDESGHICFYNTSIYYATHEGGRGGGSSTSIILTY